MDTTTLAGFCDELTKIAVSAEEEDWRKEMISPAGAAAFRGAAPMAAMAAVPILAESALQHMAVAGGAPVARTLHSSVAPYAMAASVPLALGGGLGAYYAAKKARESDPSSLENYDAAIGKGTLGGGVGSLLGAGAGAVGGGLLGEQLAPLLGMSSEGAGVPAALLGALLGGGTGGVGGYKLMTRNVGREKSAAADPNRVSPRAVLRPYAQGIAGMTLGSGIGYLTMEVADQLHRSQTGSGLPAGLKAAIPIVGAVSGFTMTSLQNKMRNAAKKELAKGRGFGK